MEPKTRERLKKYLTKEHEDKEIGDNCCEDYVIKNQKTIKNIQSSEIFAQKLKRYSALSNKKRLLMYMLIQQEETCNCALAEILELTEGSITHHIKKLQDAGLVIGKNKGHFTTYYTPETLNNLYKKNE